MPLGPDLPNGVRTPSTNTTSRALTRRLLFPRSRPAPVLPRQCYSPVTLRRNGPCDSAASLRNSFSGCLLSFLKGKPCPEYVPGGVDVGVGLVAAGETSELRL